MGIPFHTTQGTIDLTALRSSDVRADVVADGLSKINRFNGRTPEPWSVAAHSVLVSQLCPPELAAWGLLHDAHEVFLGDLTTPAVRLLKFPMVPVSAETIAYAVRRAKIDLDRQIARFWGVEKAAFEDQLLLADRAALDAELYVFLNVPFQTTDRDHADLVSRATRMIYERPSLTTWQNARAYWLEAAETLSHSGQLRLPA
ncbi:hypothetical protein [Puniceibacterium sp. IMCC21224]|uniref:hypothetical protein n=1 Tax=Puniceibacterium sp. IMCC21224 TaxID=1618204 RepID=UPI00065CE197|nr:hypothetical protein [Puniceibacterium sp. IMCC21224]KMK68560.1 hypothetical protein IMCC21224_113443 [Puniceibacterium sp. IMCC21224]